MRFADLAAMLEQRAMDEAGAGIVFIRKKGDERLSYRQLYKESLQLAGQLRSYGMRPGDEVVLRIEDMRSFVRAFWAAVLSSMIPVPLASGGGDESLAKLYKVWGVLRRPWLITDEAKMLLQVIGSGNGSIPAEAVVDWKLFVDQPSGIGHVELYSSEHVDEGDSYALPDSNADSLAFIQFSSGSTGDPKGVMLTNRNLMSNMDAIVSGSRSTPSDRSLSWMPLTHDMGLIGFHLSPIYAGMNQYLMQPAQFMMDPAMWLAKTSEYRITSIASPNFGYKHVLGRLKPSERHDWDLSAVRLIFNGAEPISAQWADRFVDALADYGLNPAAMFPVYGMAEATLAVTFPPVEERLVSVSVQQQSLKLGGSAVIAEETVDGTITFVDVGLPVADCEVRIADDEDRMLPELAVGHIHIRGAGVTTGYYNNAEANHAAFTADGWLRTGDIGFVKAGRLIITGRFKDIMFVRGQNVYPHDVERRAEELDGTGNGRAAVCGVKLPDSGDEEIVLFVVHRGKLERFAEQARLWRKQLNRELGMDVYAIVPIRTIPRTTSGKIQRYLLAERWQAGEWTSIMQELAELDCQGSQTSVSKEKDNLSSETIDGINAAEYPDRFEELTAIWREALGKEQLTIGLDSHFLELGGNSLKAAYAAHAISARWRTDISIRELYQCPTPRLLLARLAAEEAGAAIGEAASSTDLQLLVRSDRNEPFTAASYAEARIALVEQAEGIGNAYVIAVALQADGPLAADKVYAALSTLIERHETLRTSYRWQNGEVRAVPLQAGQWNDSWWGVVHVEEGRADQEHSDLLLRPFDLSSPPLLRALLVTDGNLQHELLLAIHHIAADGVAMNVLLNEFTALLVGHTLEGLQASYRDYAEMERKRHGSAVIELSLGYWKQQLAGRLPVIEWPASAARADKRTYRGGTVQSQLPASVTKRLQQLAATQHAPMSAVLQSLLGMLLHRYTGQEQFVIGMLLAGRDHPSTAAIVGMFNNYVPIRMHAAGNVSLQELLAETRTTVLDALRHGSVPYELITSLTEVSPERGRNPLFDTMLVLHNQTEGIRTAFKAAGCQFEQRFLDTNSAKLDLKLDVFPEASGELSCVWEYNEALFTRQAAERLARLWLKLVQQAVERPDATIRELELLDEQERELLLHTFNATAIEHRFEEATLHGMFRRQAERVPERIAAAFGGGAKAQLTYRELNERSDRLAKQLRRQGVQRGYAVGLMAERSPAMMVGVLGILKAGGAYVPLPPDFPTERLRFMTEESGLDVVCVQEAWGDTAAGALPEMKLLSIHEDGYCDCERSELETYDELLTNDESVTADDLAYILFTSGSTGRPKGVMIRHGAVLNRIGWMQRAYPLDAGDVIVQKTPYSFDVSVWELFWWMLAGASATFLAPGDEKDPAALLQAIEASGATTIHFVPSMLAAFTDSLQPQPVEQLQRKLRTLRRVFASGEALQPSHVDRFYEQMTRASNTESRLINLYGPTEATVDVTVYECEPGAKLRTVPIGRPIDNTTAYVLSPNGMELQPIGIAGELCIGGVQVAAGYVNRPELTAERFVPDPFSDVTDARLYRTGDLVRWTEEGTLDYLGRIDNQVKIRGHRIELGEIERALLSHEAVSEAVVTTVDGAAEGDRSIWAYIVASRTCTSTELREHCAALLPAYMLPVVCIQLEQMPLTASGKADRKALPKPPAIISMETGSTHIEPRTATEQALAALWQELLGREPIGADDDFFAIGGHSLKGASLLASIHRTFQCTLSLRDIFNHSTVRQLAARIDEQNAERRADGYEDLPKQPRRAEYPLSMGQNRLFVLQQLDPASTGYHVSATLRITGPLDLARLRAAFQSLIDQHEMLRASFHWVDGQPVMRIAPATEAEWEWVDERHSSSIAAADSFSRPFDLQQAPLLRLQLAAVDNQEHRLLLEMHHLIADGLSIAVLARQFMTLYEGQELEPSRAAYVDYSAWQEQWMSTEQSGKQEQFWQQTLAGTPPTLSLPADFSRPDRLEFAGDDVRVELNEMLVTRLQSLTTKSGATMFMTLLTAFQALLHRYTGEEDIWIGTPVGGRPHSQLHEMIGMFVNTVVIRCMPHGSLTFRELLAHTREQSISALDNDRYPFERLVDKLSVRRDNSRNPLFDVMFIVQNTSIPAVACGDVVFEPVDQRTSTSKFDLTLEVIEKAGSDSLQCRFEYRTKLFRRERIERMAGHWLRLLESAVSNPDVPLSELALLDEQEREQLLHRFNRAAMEHPYEALTLHDMFRLQAKRTPERIAAVFGGTISLTYQELDLRSDRLAKQLQSHGVRLGGAVGLMTERSPALIVGVLAIMKAGGAYVPLPPDFPAERLRFMTEDSGLEVICVQEDWVNAAASALPEKRIVTLNTEGECTSSHLSSTDDLHLSAANVTADDLAYILFTSGSTGRPKGVMIRHGAVMNRIGWMQRAYPLQAEDVIVQKTPYSFDVSVWELFWWMLAGASASFLAPGAERDPDALLQAIETSGATTIHFVPSMLAAFTESAQLKPVEQLQRKLRTLRYVFASGEALQPSHVERFYDLMMAAGNTESRLINLYGPTEATVDVTVYECEPGARLHAVPIGRPIDNTTAYVLSPNGLEFQPIGIAGELCIGGVQVAAGYVNRPELTAERFVPDPFSHDLSGRLYRSGDLVRWTEDGMLDYLGRIDNQVKIRGHRIELGEIERALLTHEAVSEAIVTVVDGNSTSKDERSICAYIVAGRSCTASELREHCAALLPVYMLPTAYVQLEQMPLTASGKADRKALPQPHAGTSMKTGTAYEEPRTETEKALAALWQELLQRDRVGARDQFFELGGNSLLLIRLHRALQDRYPQYETVSVGDLFAYPTIEQLARYLDESSIQTAVTPELIALPDSWRVELEPSRTIQLYRSTLPEETVEQLTMLGQSAGLAAQEAALGIFLLVFAQQLGRPAYELAVCGFGEEMRLLRVDLRQTRGFADIMAFVGSWQTEYSPVRAAAPKRRAIQDGEALVVFRAAPSAELTTDWTSRAAVVFGVELAASSLQLRIDASVVSKQKAAQLLQAFAAACRKLAPAAASRAEQ
ncbi:amino acid adenylation domain-containing protein [Paenibacillus sp. PR3]|uniref:Amino acid adenylation domain-containing protein n=1 Tax=Paenibacillus terricola TaxID=2763503 RepID=A0ABR8MSK2_9BACL|nr:non-ribosomal peptide synthetase [Paenibacillus terricola]MBD3917805.1 amino acid adenylation domain-containing protein [Paenibacillus terricola]